MQSQLTLKALTLPPPHRISGDVVYISDLREVHALWEKAVPWNGSVINGLFTAVTSRLSGLFISL